MKYGGSLISVSDMERSKNFYANVMEQKIGLDLGTHSCRDFLCSLIMKN